jgi:hypothetical protein
MGLSLEDIKKLHDKAYLSGQITRERAADDLVFYYITHWDDALLEESQLLYKGEFDILKKAGKDILAELDANPVQVDFEPRDELRDDVSEILDGLYRHDCQKNTSIEAFENGDRESVICGCAAWELLPEYEDIRGEDDKQVIKRKPIFEANNTVLWDPNAKFLDKSDAKYVCKLESYTEEGYKDLVEELTGERPNEINVESFKQPNESWAFPWIGGSSKARYIHVGNFYHKKREKKKIITLEDPFGQTITVFEENLEKIEDQLLDDGYEIVSEKKVFRNVVTKYIVSGAEILDESIIPGEHLPIIPQYGEHAYVDGEEHYEGMTRLAKDPQRLRDFQLSFLADIASRSPREKPIFIREQVAGLEHMYNQSGAENNYPYLLQNWKDVQGNPLPIGPVNKLDAPNIPPALISSIELSRQAIEDVASPGIPQDIADPDVSGKAILALQAKIDKQSMVYQQHRKHALRRDGEVYASMASELYDVPRKVKITLPDGTRKQVQMMEQVVTDDGELVTLRDIYNVEFDVYTKISTSYSSQKEQTIDRLESMMQNLVPNDPLREILLLKQLKLIDGVDFDDVREYANKQLVLRGIKKPETPEEEQALQQSQQQGQQPSAEMLLAMAEMKKGDAQNKQADVKLFQAQGDLANKNAKVQVDTFNAQTKRFDTQIKAQETGANINVKRADAFGKTIDNQAKIIELQKPKQLEDMEDEDIYQMILGA